MPSWVDLSEHEVALNVTQTPDGKRLILRPIAATAVIPDSVKAMGFVARDGAFERNNLKFSLSEIQAHFPRAKSREIALADILYVPQLPSSMGDSPDHRDTASPSETDIADSPRFGHEPADADAVEVDANASDEVEKFEFASTRKAGRRPSATALLHLIQTEQREWRYNLDMMHYEGSHLGRLHGSSEIFHTREAAMSNALGLLVRDQQSILAPNAGSMVTDGQRKAARQLLLWAYEVALPAHKHFTLQSGTYAGWHRAEVSDGPFKGTYGVGFNLDAARENLRLRIERRLHPADAAARPIGENRDGGALFEDNFGTRSLILDGKRRSERLVMTSAGPRLDVDDRSVEFLTKDELQQMRGTIQDAAADHPEKVRVGEGTGGKRVDALVNDVPIHFEIASSQETVAYAHIDGDWRRLGEAWPARPTDSELRIALRAAALPSTSMELDGMQLVESINAEIDAENSATTDPSVRRPLLPEDLDIRRIDALSLEVRFQAPALPFAVRVEQTSPGVYRSLAGSAASSPRLSLSRAMEWAAGYLVDQRVAYEHERRLAESPFAEYVVDAESFEAFFGASRDAEESMDRIREYAAAAQSLPADQLRNALSNGRLFYADLPDDLTATWVDGHMLELGISGPTSAIAVRLRASAPVDAAARPLVAAGAIGTGLRTLEAERAWQKTKASRSDGGASLDRIAQDYATFLREKMPSHHSGHVGVMHRQFAIAIVDREVDYLLSWIARAPGQNDLSKRFFAQETGVKLPRTARDIKWAVYAWAGFELQEAQRIDADKAERKAAKLKADGVARELEHLERSLQATQVRHNGVVKSTKAFLDEVMSEGFTLLETHRVGAVNRYRLVHEAEERCYALRGSQVDYVRHALAKKLALEDEPAPELTMSVRPPAPFQR
ncbi:hypothetical protein KDX16_28270 [Burkholderia vietnamiensis]|uniref:hypothetical protein n=1 Tax=Burkholderia vietnamiensis TaxID=60552 RepID=UPI001B90E308|nr:hypothetical protein [Burkholderia vietnamiensis]MBR7919696.1 hypothetical protein [Burkholderia vietnamiensis]MBR8205345.1 hypothetical protein [Burkholderia vietnamiensis]